MMQKWGHRSTNSQNERWRSCPTATVSANPGCRDTLSPSLGAAILRGRSGMRASGSAFHRQIPNQTRLDG